MMNFSLRGNLFLVFIKVCLLKFKTMQMKIQVELKPVFIVKKINLKKSKYYTIIQKKEVLYIS